MGQGSKIEVDEVKDRLYRAINALDRFLSNSLTLSSIQNLQSLIDDVKAVDTPNPFDHKSRLSKILKTTCLLKELVNAELRNDNAEKLATENALLYCRELLEDLVDDIFQTAEKASCRDFEFWKKDLDNRLSRMTKQGRADEVEAKSRLIYNSYDQPKYLQPVPDRIANYDPTKEITWTLVRADLQEYVHGKEPEVTITDLVHVLTVKYGKLKKMEYLKALSEGKAEAFEVGEHVLQTAGHRVGLMWLLAETWGAEFQDVGASDIARLTHLLSGKPIPNPIGKSNIYKKARERLSPELKVKLLALLEKHAINIGH